MFDDFSYEMMISSISASNIHSILKPWPELKSLEIPEIIDMKELDFKPFQNLEKVSVHTKFPTNEELPWWIKVTKMSFNPKESQFERLTIENASKLAFQCGPAIHVRELREDHLANIAKMKNLENLFCFLCQFDHGYEVILRPFMDILQSNCFKIRSLEVDHWDDERNSLL